MRDKKLCILSLSSLLAIPFKDLPAILQNGFKDIIVVVLKLIKAFQHQKQLAEKEYSSGDEDEDEEEDDEDDLLADDEDAMGEVNPIVDSIKEYSDQIVADVLTDSEIYTSPLDDIDEIEYFLNGLKHFSDKQPSVFNQLLPSLAAEEVNFIKYIKENNPNKKSNANDDDKSND